MKTSNRNNTQPPTAYSAVLVIGRFGAEGRLTVTTKGLEWKNWLSKKPEYYPFSSLKELSLTHSGLKIVLRSQPFQADYIVSRHMRSIAGDLLRVGKKLNTDRIGSAVFVGVLYDVLFILGKILIVAAVAALFLTMISSIG